MNVLKEKLTSAPVLAYPSCDQPFTVETNANISGVGAVLSQVQEDGKLHPVAFASRSLSTAGKNYSVMELETLAVFWALTRFHSYLYGQTVTVMTDHTAVRVILETPNPSGKHARWWTKVYGMGIKQVKIIHRSGKLNVSADALSRSPRVQLLWKALQKTNIRLLLCSQYQGQVLRRMLNHYYENLHFLGVCHIRRGASKGP